MPDNRLSDEAINAWRRDRPASATSARDARPPNPQEVRVDGQETAFGGTNPWTGPYLVGAILGMVALVVAIVVAAMLL